jgi:hypothetical protein
MCMFAVVVLIVGEPETFLVTAGLELGYHEGVYRGGTDVLLPAEHTAAGRWGRDPVPDAFPTERCSRTTAKDILGCDLDRDCDLHDLCVDPLRIEWPIEFQDTYYGRAGFPTVERRREWPVSSISLISSTFSITTRSLDPSILLFQHITMGANVSVSRLSTIGPGQAFNTQIPHGKLSRSAIAALGELGYGQTGYNDEPAVVNFFATASQAEEYHKRAIELLKEKTPKKLRAEFPIVVKPCRVTRMIQPTAM